MEYIERELVEKMIEDAQIISDGENCGYCTDDISISSIPAADVAPVVHGKWGHTHTSESYFNECWRCSACGFDDTEGFGFKFCPNCGAKMDQLG